MKMLLQWVPVQPSPAVKCLKPCKAFHTCPAETQEMQIKLVCDLPTKMWPCQGVSMSVVVTGTQVLCNLSTLVVMTALE